MRCWRKVTKSVGEHRGAGGADCSSGVPWTGHYCSFSRRLWRRRPGPPPFRPPRPPTLGKDGIVPPQRPRGSPIAAQEIIPTLAGHTPHQHPFVAANQPGMKVCFPSRPDAHTHHALAAAPPLRPHAARPATQSGADSGVGGSVKER